MFRRGYAFVGVRAALFVSAMLAIMALARPSWAASPSFAPFCDDRGATANAQPPALESLDDALWAVRTTSCSLDRHEWRATMTKGRNVEAPPNESASAVLPCLPSFGVVPEHALTGPPASTTGPRQEPRSRVERPPRG